MNPPTGTVTFLFTDIEGSTQLWEHYPDAMKAALTEHDEVLRKAIESNEGYVFKTVGDAFCAAFSTAPQALSACLAAQRSLAGPLHGLEIKVRFGLHSGASEERDGDYFGPTLNRAARLMSAGHGGQILISQATQELLRDRLPSGVSLSDLGERQLKDLVRSERIWQVGAEDLPKNFARLKTLEDRPHNLPVQLTSFIGRENEMDQIKAALLTHRLVTLTGPGGTGKTRLSLQVGSAQREEFSHGVWLVELAALTEGSAVAQEVSGVLGLALQAGRSATETVKDALRERQILLILDNCEHLTEACARLTETLIKNCPQLRVLASSRERLGVSGEHAYRVPSMAAPRSHDSESLDHLLSFEAVRLFLDRAAEAKPTFRATKENSAALARVCASLDGIPLAIELAAARIKILSVEQIAARLDDVFKLLTGGSRNSLPRQQTLRALIDWSWSLLTLAEQRMLRRMGIFIGGFSLEAAESVAFEEGSDPLELLSSLADKSLIQVNDTKSEVRYHLQETLRVYALERLQDAHETALAAERHASVFEALSLRLGAALRGSPEQDEALLTCDLEEANLQAAITWGQEQSHRSQADLIILNAVDPWVRMRDHKAEWLRLGALSLMARAGLPPTWEQLCLVVLRTRLTFFAGDYSECLKSAESAWDFAQRLGTEASRGLGQLARAMSAWVTGSTDLGLEAAHEAITLIGTAGLEEWKSEASWAWLSHADKSSEPLARVQTVSNEILAQYRSRNDNMSEAIHLAGQSTLFVRTGEWDKAIDRLEQALALAKAHEGAWSMNTVSLELAELHLRLGQVEKASRLLLRGIEEATKKHIGWALLWSESLRGLDAELRGDLAGAEAHFRAAVPPRPEGRADPTYNYRSLSLASFFVRQRREEEATNLLRGLLDLAQFGFWPDLGYQLLELAAQLLVARDSRIAATLLGHVDELRNLTLVARFPSEGARIEHLRRQIADSIGSGVTAKHLDEGAQLTKDQAIELARRQFTTSTV